MFAKSEGLSAYVESKLLNDGVGVGFQGGEKR